MKHYRITFEVQSAVSTPFRSDTIFGHLCWAYRFLKGEQELETLLAGLDNGTVLTLSGGFPHNCVPVPQLRPLTPQEREQWINEHCEGKVDKGAEVLKKIRKQQFIAVDQLQKIRNCLSPLALCTILRTQEDRNAEQSAQTSHNTINRITNHVENLYAEDVVFFERDAKIDVYLATDLFTQAEVQELFEYIGMSGYGKNASTGKGKLGNIAVEETNLPEFPEADAFILLSDCVPDSQFPKNGWYDLITKQPKIGPALQESNPFKKRMIMLRQGSTFQHAFAPERRFGILLADVHPTNPKVRHSAFAYPLWVKLEGQQ